MASVSKTDGQNQKHVTPCRTNIACMYLCAKVWINRCNRTDTTRERSGKAFAVTEIVRCCQWTCGDWVAGGLRQRGWHGCRWEWILNYRNCLEHICSCKIKWELVPCAILALAPHLDSNIITIHAARQHTVPATITLRRREWEQKRNFFAFIIICVLFCWLPSTQ